MKLYIWFVNTVVNSLSRKEIYRLISKGLMRLMQTNRASVKYVVNILKMKRITRSTMNVLKLASFALKDFVQVEQWMLI